MQFMRIIACFSNIPLNCVTFSAFWQRHWSLRSAFGEALTRCYHPYHTVRWPSTIPMMAPLKRQSQIYKICRGMRFPTMWYCDKCILRQACAASFYSYRNSKRCSVSIIFKRQAKALIRLRVCAG